MIKETDYTFYTDAVFFSDSSFFTTKVRITQGGTSLLMPFTFQYDFTANSKSVMTATRLRRGSSYWHRRWS